MAGSVKGLVIEIGGDTSGLQKALSKVNSSTASLSKELRGVNSLLKLDPSNTDMLSQKQKILKNNIEETSNKLKQLKEFQKVADNQIASGAEISDENYRSLQREIANTEIKLKKLKLEASNWTQTGKSIEEFGEKVSNISSKLDKMGTTLTTRITLPAAAIATGLINSAKEFETAFTGVEKTVDGTAEQITKLKQGIKDMSEEMPSTTTEISAVAEAAGQLGIQTDNVLDFTKTMIDMGNATNLSADEAATTLARFANVTKMSQTDFSKLGSVIVDLGNNFATTESEIAEMGMNLASAGTQVGMSQAQIMGLATALSSVGLEAQAGGTAFSKVMVNMQLAVEKGGGELTNFAKVAGMTTKEFSNAFKKDATTAIMKFVEGLSKSGERGKSAIKVLDDMGITETRLRDSLLRSANASSIFSKAIDVGTKAWNENTALANEANKKYQTLESRMKMTTNKINNMATNLGNKLTPSMNKVLDKVDGLIDNINGLSEEETENIIKTAAFVAAIGPAIKILGTLGNTVGSATKGIGTFAQAIGVVANKSSSTNESVNKLANVMQNLTNPIGLTVAGIVALTASLVAVEKSIMKNAEAAKQLKNGVEENIEARKQLKEQQEQQISSNLAEINNTKSLYDELKTITDENGNIKKGYEDRANFIVSRLNSALGTEIKINGNVIQSYKNIQSEIDKTILKKKAEIYMQTQEENYSTALKNRANTYKELAELQNKLTDAQKRYSEAQENINKSGGIKKVLAVEDMRAAKTEIQNLNTAIDEQKGLISGYSDDVKLYEENMNLMAQGTVESFNKVIDNSNKKMTEQKVNLEGTLSEQINTLSESIEKQKQLLLIARQNQDKTNMDAYNEQIKADEKQMVELGKQLAKMTSSIETLTPEQVEAWRKLSQSSKTAFNESIQYLPADVQNKLKEVLNITEQSAVPDQFGNLGNMSLNSFDTNISNMSNDTDLLLKRISNNVNADTSVKDSTKNLALKADEGFNNNVNGSKWGNDLASNISAGMTSKTSESKIISAGSMVAGWISSLLHHSVPDKGPLKDEMEYMPDMIDNLCNTLEKSSPKLGKKTLELAEMMSRNLNLEDFQGNMGKKIIQSSKTIYTTPKIVFNVQELDEAKLEQCFNYVNKKFGTNY